MEPSGISVYADAVTRIEFFRSKIGNGNLVITFTEFSNRRLDGLGFAGKFALDAGFDIVAVKTASDDWYHNLSSNLINIISGFIEQVSVDYDNISSYGSSMGGYAAIKFAKALSCKISFAISPQFDITCNWDTRWSVPARNITDFTTLSVGDVAENCVYYIAYDPFDTDKEHVRRFTDVLGLGRVIKIPVAFAGHPVGYMLSHADVLKPITTSVLCGNGVPDSKASLRMARRNYAPYFFNISNALANRRKLVSASRAIEKAIAIDPYNADYRMLSSKINEKLGKVQRAVEGAAFASTFSPTNDHMRANLARLLGLVGKKSIGMKHIEICLQNNPANAAFAQIRNSLR